MNQLELKGMLQRLTKLYYADPADLETYYQALKESRRRAFYAFPGMTVVLAEVADHDYAPAMTHVLAPEMATVEHTLGWHDFFTAQLALDDGKTSLSDVVSLEVRMDDGTWLAGTVSAGGPASQQFLLTTATSEQRFLQHSDTVRNIAFREQRESARA